LQSINTKITVLLPVYNGEKYLNKCIDSILNQTFKDFTLLIIDDKSTDKSLDIIKSYSSNNSQVLLVQNESNIGLTKTLNKGINFTNSKYIARIDQDDISDSYRLELQEKFLSKNSDIALLGSFCKIIDSKNKFIGEWKTSLDHSSIINSIYKKNPFAHSSVIFDREKIISLGCYPEDYLYAQDLALWLKIMLKFKVANLNNFLTNIRVHNQQFTSDNKFAEIKMTEELKLAKRCLYIPKTFIKTKLNLTIKILIIYLGLFKKKLLKIFK